MVGVMASVKRATGSTETLALDDSHAWIWIHAILFRAVPVGSDREADVWDDVNRDLRVGDPVDAASARLLLGHYQRVMNLLTAGDVIMRHEDSFVEG